MKPLLTLGWRRWTIMALGALLFASPWVLGIPAGEASAIDSWLVGSSLVLVAWRVPAVAGHLAASLTSVAFAGWLLVSPFALGFAGSAAAWLQAWRLRYGIRRISPQRLARSEEPVQTVTAQKLSRSIVERAHQIERAMRGHPSRIEGEMCIAGYRSCVSDMVTLVHIIDKELPEAGPLRRLRLKVAQDMAARSLQRARYVIPANALRLTHA